MVSFCKNNLKDTSLLIKNTGFIVILNFTSESKLFTSNFTLPLFSSSIFVVFIVASFPSTITLIFFITSKELKFVIKYFFPSFISYSTLSK